MKQPFLYFAKNHPKAIIPSKRLEDAGYDIYMIPSEESIRILPGETYLAPTGLKSAFPAGYVLLGRERGSTGTKGLRFGAGVIDSGYRGEILIPINNTSNKTIILSNNPEEEFNKDTEIVYSQSKAIGQLLLVPIAEPLLMEVSLEDLEKIKSERGTGKLGSSGK